MVGKDSLRAEDLNLCFEKLMMVAGSGNGEKGVNSKVGVITEWKDIPVELLMQILSLVDDQTVITASGVCRGWRDAIYFGLARLSLSWCSKSMNNLVLSLVPKFVKLQTLILRQDKPQLEDNAVETIAKCCHELQILDLSKSFKLTDHSLYELALGCRDLTKLNISGCSAFSDNALAYLASFCRKLKVLNLCGCVRAASDTALLAIGQYCNQLQSLNLGWCDNVGDVGVTTLAYGCPDLRIVDLCGCVRITDDSVIALATRCPHLRSLGLYYCKNITDRAMYSLAHSKVNNRMWGSVKGTFQQNYIAANASYNAFSSTQNIAKMEFHEKNLEKTLVAQEEENEHCVLEQRNITSNSTSGQIFQINAVGRSDSSDDDHVRHDGDAFQSDFRSESCSGSIDDSLKHRIPSSNHSCEGFDFVSHKDERVEDIEETQYSCESEVSNSQKTKETMWEDNLDESDFDEAEDEDEDDFEWEHDEVVEQLRMELKNARQGGLATILEEEEEEETESPKNVEDLKPLKIEEKLEFKDHIIEIQKVYRCYAEKIRKLDVLNYQTMHAIGLLELKDPLKLMSIPKSTVQSAKPLSQNLWPRKAQKQISDPILKFVQELHGDLELVYVGQVCLSWEILCWQHKKVQELKQYDSQWPRSYNLVAGDFQLFQVLMQRFLEDEPFQGPRIQNYVKNRCVIRNLLQVPVIKDDNTKDKKIIKLGEEHAIDSERLAQIIKESMRVFWEFVRADKDYGNVIKISHQIGVDVKDPAISDLLGNVRTQLQKKERKLKDIVRSGNCIVRKFQKHHEEQIQLDEEQLLAQVGLRLVSRVMHMKKLRKDQLMWCNEKLNRIKFDGRKVQVEPSFFVFSLLIDSTGPATVYILLDVEILVSA